MALKTRNRNFWAVLLQKKRRQRQETYKDQNTDVSFKPENYNGN